MNKTVPAMKTIAAIVALVVTLHTLDAQPGGQPATAPSISSSPSVRRTSNAPPDYPYAAGLLSEEGEQDLPSAAMAYRQAIQEFDRQREGAANAIFRLGEVYRKMGRLEEAKVQYARILREFPDMVRLTELSHALLFADEPKPGGRGVGGFGGDGGVGGTGAGFGGGGGAGGTALTQRGAAATQSVPTVQGHDERLMKQRYGTSERIECANNLKQIALAARIFATDYQGAFPSNIEAMSNEIPMPKILVCPSDNSRQPAASWRDFDPAIHMTYQYLGASARDSEPGRELLRCPIHGNVALADGSVQEGRLDRQSGAPPMEIMRQRYGLSPSDSPPARDTDDILNTIVGSAQQPPLRQFRGLPTTLAAITIAADGTLRVAGDPVEMDGLTTKLKEMPADLRAKTPLVVLIDKKTELHRIIEVLDACKAAGVNQVSLAADSIPAIQEDLAKLTAEAEALQGELDVNEQNRIRIDSELAASDSELQEAQSQFRTARQRFDALSVPAQLLPRAVNQDERYQRLKAEYESTVLDGKNPDQEKRALARLAEWVDKIYRPELKTELELAESNFRDSLQRQEDLKNRQRALKSEYAEKLAKRDGLVAQYQQLSPLLSELRASQQRVNP